MSVRGVRPTHPLFICQWFVARGTAALAVVFALAGPAIAQTTAPPAQPPAPAPPPVVAGWNEGFFIQTPNGDNRLQIGFILQADGRFALDDPLPIINTFVMRKARPVFTGRVAQILRLQAHARTGRRLGAAARWLLRHPLLAQAPAPERQGQDAGRLRDAHRRHVPDLSRSDRSCRSWFPTATSAFRRRASSPPASCSTPPVSSTAILPMAPARSPTSTRTTARTSPGASCGCPSDRPRRRRTR